MFSRPELPAFRTSTKHILISNAKKLSRLAKWLKMNKSINQNPNSARKKSSKKSEQRMEEACWVGTQRGGDGWWQLLGMWVMSTAITVSFVNFFLSLNTTLLLGKINTKHFNQTLVSKHSEGPETICTYIIKHKTEQSPYNYRWGNWRHFRWDVYLNYTK